MTRCALILLLLSGCATQPVFKTVPPASVSPKLYAIQEVEGPSVPQRSVALVLPSRTNHITLTWDYPVGERWYVDYFKLYSTTNLLRPFSLKLTTTNQTVTLQPTNRSEFFYVTAFGVNGTESGPNTK